MFKTKEKAAEVVFFIFAATSVACVALICLFLFVGGIPGIREIGFFNFILGHQWRPLSHGYFGIFPMIVATLATTALALLFAVPVGIMTAIFLVKFCNKKIQGALTLMVSLLAAIPSVVYGFFGMVVILPLIATIFGVGGGSLLAASIILAIMILPTIIAISQSAIKAVPETYYEGALALGATKEEAVFFATLPAAKSGVISSVVLGLGRCIGETMAVIMVAGNQVQIPHSLFDGVRTLTSNIVLEMGYAEGVHRDALLSTALILFVFILLINFVFSILKRKI